MTSPDTGPGELPLPSHSSLPSRAVGSSPWNRKQTYETKQRHRREERLHRVRVCGEVERAYEAEHDDARAEESSPFPSLLPAHGEVLPLG
jgi:hypothetical protein